MFPPETSILIAIESDLSENKIGRKAHLLVDADRIWHHDRVAGCGATKSIHVYGERQSQRVIHQLWVKLTVNHSEAITAQLEIVCGLASATLAKVVRRLAVDG